MKLWQKVFLLSLLLILLAIDVTAGIILYTSHELMMEREQEQAVSRHQYLSATLQNRIVSERLRQNQPLLAAGDVDALLNTLVASQASGNDGVAIYRDGKAVSELQAAPLTQDFRDAVWQSADINPLMTIVRPDGRAYILVGTPVSMEGNPYTLFTITDISTVYDTLDEQMQFVRIVSLVFAGLTGGVLMLIVFRLLSPLGRIYTTLNDIAGGNYHLRLEEKGGQEFCTLARSVNQMAASIEENVSQISAVAQNRKQFIDNLAHEMKTPLTSILGFADILRIKRSVSEKQRQEYAGIIVEETKRLQALSGKLMELITTGNMDPEWEDIPADGLLGEIARTMAPLLARRSLTLLLAVEPGIVLHVDRTLFASLLHNLIDNAAKASVDGQQIVLSCRRDGQRVRLSVIDHGMGMAPRDAARATEPFYMVDKSRSRKAGGAGLGLALCAEIARRHGAELLIDSLPGEGTTVTVVLGQEEESK